MPGFRTANLQPQASCSTSLWVNTPNRTASVSVTLLTSPDVRELISVLKWETRGDVLNPGTLWNN